jgi:hypothetical protein
MLFANCDWNCNDLSHEQIWVDRDKKVHLTCSNTFVSKLTFSTSTLPETTHEPRHKKDQYYLYTFRTNNSFTNPNTLFTIKHNNYVMELSKFGNKINQNLVQFTIIKNNVKQNLIRFDLFDNASTYTYVLHIDETAPRSIINFYLYNKFINMNTFLDSSKSFYTSKRLIKNWSFEEKNEKVNKHVKIEIIFASTVCNNANEHMTLNSFEYYD